MLDPRLPVKSPVLSNPKAIPIPDRTAIPSGQGILRNGDGSRPCNITLDLRSLDEIDEVLANGKSASGLKAMLAKMKEQEARGERVSVPSGTPVRVVERRERLKAQMVPKVTKIEVLDGPHKGISGWCPSNFVVTSLQTAADRDAAEAEVLWRTATFQEQQGKLERALIEYRDIVKSFPDTPRAKQAAERIKALTAEK